MRYQSHIRSCGFTGRITAAWTHTIARNFYLSSAIWLSLAPRKCRVFSFFWSWSNTVYTYSDSFKERDVFLHTPNHHYSHQLPQRDVLSPLLFNIRLTHLKRVLPPGDRVTLYTNKLLHLVCGQIKSLNKTEAPETPRNRMWITCAKGFHISPEKRCHSVHQQGGDKIPCSA